MIETWLAIATGGALGAALRGCLIRWVAGGDFAVLTAASFPIGPAFATLLANTLGCLLLSAWLFGAAPVDEGLLPFWVETWVVAGICGGLTTFSTLCADAVRLHEERGSRVALAYLGVSLMLGLLAVWLGRLLFIG